MIKWLIFVVLFVVLCVVAPFLIYFGVHIWAQFNKEKIETRKLEIQKDAEMFALNKNSDDCLACALSLMPENEGFTAEIDNAVFLSFCLKAAEYKQGFCDDIPDEEKSGLMEIANWKRYKCSKDSPDYYECKSIWNTVMEFCTERRQGNL